MKELDIRVKESLEDNARNKDEVIVELYKLFKDKHEKLKVIDRKAVQLNKKDGESRETQVKLDEVNKKLDQAKKKMDEANKKMVKAHRKMDEAHMKTDEAHKKLDYAHM